MNDSIEKHEGLDWKVPPVCAIGASAGGVTALQNLFRHLQTDLGLAYVVILHLPPDHRSMLEDILSGATRMPVHQVVDGPRLSPNCVYVIPPDGELVIEGDRVQTRPFQEPRGRRAPIDIFFRSVASARGDGIGVILSGSGADGTLGVRAIKEAGGVVMVQEPAEAGFASMPQNAIATGVADFVAPLARLAELVAEVARSKEAVRSLEINDSANDLRRIVAFLRAHTGHDFSSYKRATVLRRVLRRMQVRHAATLASYADILLTTPEESKELFSDLLISVTTFFRDPPAFDALQRKAIKPIFDSLHVDAGEGVRAWAVGCATGEEAYSLAILFQEEALRRKVQPKLQIIASDLDESALATAREGRYPRSIEADVSEERLSRFFVDEGAHYRVRSEVRESVLFAAHNVIKDPPFRRLDLITCRNLLIYLERSLQQQLCSIFHYGLKPGSFLFLGSAETADAVTDLFAPLDREARIYSARRQVGRTAPNLPSFASPERIAIADHSPPRTMRGTSSEAPVALHATALERNTPPSALVDDRQNVVHLSPSAGRFILHSAGPLSNVLPNMVRPELRLDLRLALTRALDRKEPTLTVPAAVAFETEQRRITMYVAPAQNGENVGAQALVLFLDGGAIAPSAEEEVEAESRPEETRRLHAELRAAQEALVDSQTGHEAAIEDLRATNEELQSINEEFRSTAEELETSKEELQSINEELHTVNAELKSKLISISVAHSDLQNLTAATEIGTLFLDANLRIKMFTPPIADLFNITQADIGRDFTDFTHRLEYVGLEADTRRVLQDLAPIEREVASADGRWFVMRLRPYRTVEDRIDGAVATFVDITARLLAESALSRSERAFRALVSASAQVIYRMSPAWDELRELVGGGFLSDTNRPDESWLEHYIHPEDHAKIRAVIQAAIDAKGVFDLEHRVRRIDGAWGWTHSRAIPILNDRGDIVEWFGSASDVTSRRRAQEALRESEARWRALIEGVPQLVWRAFEKGQWTWASPQWTEYTGLSQRDSLAWGWTGPVHPEDRENAIARWQEAESTGAYESEYRILRAGENRYRWFQTRASPVRDEQSRIVEWLGTSTDVDDIRAQGRQEVMVAELQHRTRNLLTVVRSIAEQTMRGSDTMPEFWVTFERRLAALSRVQGLLSRSENEPITIGAVVRSELEAFAAADMSDRVVVEGPEVRLRKSSVQTLALALHELATNARKHGALANDVGRLRITWSTYADAVGDRLSMEWRETGIDATGVKDAAERGTTGFGRLLIERALPHTLHARTTFELGEKELRCTMDFPLAERFDRGDRE